MRLDVLFRDAQAGAEVIFLLVDGRRHAAVSIHIAVYLSRKSKMGKATVVLIP